MKIRNKLYISAGISIILAVILISIVLVTSSRIDQVNEEHHVAMEIKTDISELDIVAYEYLLHHEKRMEQQWNLKYNSIAEILGKAEENGLIKSIRADYVALGDLFLQVTTNYKKKQKLIQEEASQEKINIFVLLEERLVAQLLIKSQSIITDASRLEEKAYAEAMETQELVNTLTLILIIIFAITVTTTSLLVAMAIAEPLHKLHSATEIFEEGKLDYRIKIKTKDGIKPRDEIEQLSRAFNKMAEGLENRSKELQKEITKRKKTEENLKKRVEELEKFHKITVGREVKMVELKKKIKDLGSKK